MPEWIIRNSADLKRKSGKQGPQGSSCKWSSGSLLALTQAVQVSIQVLLLLLPAFLNLALDAATTLSPAEHPQLTAAAGPTPPVLKTATIENDQQGGSARKMEECRLAS